MLKKILFVIGFITLSGCVSNQTKQSVKANPSPTNFNENKVQSNKLEYWYSVVRRRYAEYKYYQSVDFDYEKSIYAMKGLVMVVSIESAEYGITPEAFLSQSLDRNIGTNEWNTYKSIAEAPINYEPKSKKKCYTEGRVVDPVGTIILENHCK